MHHDPESEAPQLSLQKTEEIGLSREGDPASSVEVARETPFQIFSSNGLPAWIGATGALVVAGTAFVPAVLLGGSVGAALAFLRLRAQP